MERTELIHKTTNWSILQLTKLTTPEKTRLMRRIGQDEIPRSEGNEGNIMKQWDGEFCTKHGGQARWEKGAG